MLYRDVANLTRLKHPGILKLVEPFEETRQQVSLHRLLSPTSVQSNAFQPHLVKPGKGCRTGSNSLGCRISDIYECMWQGSGMGTGRIQCCFGCQEGRLVCFHLAGRPLMVGLQALL